MTKTKVFLVDDHPIVRQGLKQLVNHQADLVTCGEAADAASALEGIEHLKPDVLVVDISLAGRSGFDLIKALKTKSRDLPALVLSMHDEELYAERALRAGARGYIMKEEAPENLVEAIRLILKGEVYLSRKMSSLLLKRLSKTDGSLRGSPLELLSDRELEVFQSIGQGKSTRQIAVQFNLSVKTIETYRAHIMEKLDLEDARSLVQYAVQSLQSDPHFR